MKIKESMEKLGFSLGETGGHCTAWMKSTEDGGMWMVTTTDGCNAPNNLMAPVLFGVHDKDGVEQSCKRYSNLRVLINALRLLTALREK